MVWLNNLEHQQTQHKEYEDRLGDKEVTRVDKDTVRVRLGEIGSMSTALYVVEDDARRVGRT